jgi:hypothetical protein
MPALKKKHHNPLIEFPSPKPSVTTAITPRFLDIKQATTFIKDPLRAVDAARYIGVSKKTLLKYCSQHLITFMRYPDGSFRFLKAALDLFIAKCTIQAGHKVAQSSARCWWCWYISSADWRFFVCPDVSAARHSAVVWMFE